MDSILVNVIVLNARSAQAISMRRFLLLAWLLPVSLCSAQILMKPVPHATSYIMLAGQPPRAVISPWTKEESDKFHQVYTAVLQADASLDAEGDALSAQLGDYQKTLKAAMVQADPKIAPALEQASGGSLTSEQYDTIHKLQADALKADPKLQADWDELSKKLEAHRQKVDAAMAKLDPSVAPILAKLSP